MRTIDQKRYSDNNRRVYLTDKQVVQMRELHRSEDLSVPELSKLFNCTDAVIRGHLHTIEELAAYRLYQKTDGKEGKVLPYLKLTVSDEERRESELEAKARELEERAAALAAREAALSGSAEDAYDVASCTPTDEDYDEFGPLEGTPAWGALGAQAKGALTKKRNAAAALA